MRYAGFSCTGFFCTVFSCTLLLSFMGVGALQAQQPQTPPPTKAESPATGKNAAAYKTEFDETRAVEMSMYNRAKLPPTILKYDQDKDEFAYVDSPLSGTMHRPGAPTAYYGSRLTEFRFTGPPGRGGIYDAIEWYNRVHHLNPLKYQYRFR